MIHGIFFDAAGVLYRRSEPTETFALNLLKQNGFATEVSAQDLARQKNLRAQASEGRVSHEVYWNQFLKIAHDETEREGVYIHLARIHLALNHFDDSRRALDAVTNKMYSTLKNRLTTNLNEAIQHALTNAPPQPVR